MQDFPPTVSQFHGLDGQPPAADPDLRSPARFLLWLMRRQLGVITTAMMCAVLWQLPLAVGPWLVGRAVDQGVLGRSASAIWQWAALLFLVTLIGAVFGILLHTLAVRSWLIALYGTTSLIARKTTQLGHLLPRRTPTGEVLSVASSDADQFGGLIEVTARALAQVISYLVVAAIVLHTSPRLGVMVLVAGPVLVGVALPLLGPLHRRQEVERRGTSTLTSQATDIVAGLRILRGIGGEETFRRSYAAQSQQTRAAGVAAGILQAVVEAVGVLASGVFLVLLMYTGALALRRGQLTIGELVSFLGYGLFMIGPISTFFEFAQKLTRSLVSARKAVAVFEQRPPWSEPAEPQPLPLPTRGDLVDEVSGFVARSGLLTVVVSAVPETSAALADRLGRWLPLEEDPPPLDVEQDAGRRRARRARAEHADRRARLDAADAVRAAGSWGVTYGGVDLARLPIRELRRAVLVSDTASELFAGSLQDAVDPHRVLSRQQAERALRSAAAEDVYDALPGGWAGELDERGRGLSGGQRQRVVLARAVAADPDVLVLVEPTSAVDAHTETRIAQRVASHRLGRTTVVTTLSPLWLHHADHVVLLEGGRVVAQGRHEQLLDEAPRYREVVLRTVEPVLETGLEDSRA